MVLTEPGKVVIFKVFIQFSEITITDNIAFGSGIDSRGIPVVDRILIDIPVLIGNSDQLPETPVDVIDSFL